MLRFVIILLGLLFAVPSLATERLLVFAAASQKDAMEEIGAFFQTQCECDVVFSFAATSTLARQIDAGSDADVFISANQAWADWLEIRGATTPETREIIAGNRLVVASAEKGETGAQILAKGRFAMADPISVPAGIYAREALETLGLWNQVRKNAVYAENVRVALSAIARGDLLSGIIYQSDVKSAPQLNMQFVFPETSHRPIHYVASAVADSDKGRDFVRFLLSDKAQAIFQRFGFLPLSATNQ